MITARDELRHYIECVCIEPEQFLKVNKALAWLSPEQAEAVLILTEAAEKFVLAEGKSPLAESET